MSDQITEPKFKRRLQANFFIRFHMTLILSAVVFSGVITSKALLWLGVTSMPVRYPIAVLCAYAVFFLLMRLWLWYIGISPRARRYVEMKSQSKASRSGSGGGGFSLDFGSGGGGGGSRWGGFGGGSSGGGGASESWGDASSGATWLSSSEPMPASGGSFNLGSLGSSSSGSSGSSFDLDFGDDGCLPIVVLVLLIALVMGIFGAGAYLIYQAPAIFAEAAFQAALASGLIKATKGIDNPGWKGSVFKATRFPLAVVLVLAVAFGWAAHRYCPAATKAAEVFKACKRVE